MLSTLFSGTYPNTTSLNLTSPLSSISSPAGSFHAKNPVLSEVSVRVLSAFLMTLHKVTFPSSGSSASSIMSNILSAPESAESMKLTCCVNWFNGMALCLTYTRYADMLPRSMIPFITNMPPTQAESA